MCTVFLNKLEQVFIQEEDSSQNLTISVISNPLAVLIQAG